MLIVDAVIVLGVVGVVAYFTIKLLTRPQERRPVVPSGQWRVTHYDVKGVTRVVLQKVSPSGTHVLDEHVVGTIPISDPEYDVKFLEATATARQRRAVFEAEEE